MDEQERLLCFSFDVRNMSASPFYYDWPVRVSLLDVETKTPVWSRLLPDVSVMDWLPGEKWQADARAYADPAPTYTVSGTFKLPDEVETGSYVLAMSIPDPVGLHNATVFMNTGYIAGGYTALRVVGVGETPEQTLNMPSMIIPGARDEALYYDANAALRRTSEAAQLMDGLSATTWQGREATIDIESVCRFTSMTLCFVGERQSFTVQYSQDGESWTDCEGELFEARNGETHLSLGRVRARFVRVSFAQDARLSQVRIYGQ